MKIAMLFQYAPAYREAIYKKIENTFNVEWFFCDNAIGPVKLMDYKALESPINEIHEVIIRGNYRYIRKFNPKIFENFDAIIFLGDIRNLSYWKLLFYKKWSANRPKMITWTHGWYGRESFIQRFIKRIFLRKADAILLYGEYAKGLMEANQFPSSKLFVIANSLDYDKQLVLRRQMESSPIYKDHFKNDNPNVIFIGRQTFEKKLDMLLNAVKSLQDNGLNINAVFVGSGEAENTLKELAKSLGIEQKVWFYGACYQEDINAQLIYNSDLCISPGNVGLTAIHSLMFGCPVITHNDYSHQGPEFEAIKVGQTGDFFEKDSIESLTKTIRNWFLENNIDREWIRQQCYKEIDTRWNPYFQMETLKQVLN